ncbi:MAG TPA: RluA family pseudouridine synthase, partial [Turneriella sp.]|nr:RluA family pseudouridine synthase [Turneriella sp.]
VWPGNELRVEYHPKNITSHETNALFDGESILYHEDGILIVNKPAGLPTVATIDNARDNLVTQLKVYLGRDMDRPPVESRPGTSMYLGIHHRLDAPTSGLILFTTKEEMNPFAARLFQESLIHKEYLAVCIGGNPTVGKKWEIKNQLARAAKKKNIYHSSQEGSFAYSRFEVLAIKDNRALVRCVPITGRTHQLRVHLSEYGMPVVGDRTYGGVAAPRLMLHAHRLTFRHPHEAHEVVVEAPVPKEFDFFL